MSSTRLPATTITTTTTDDDDNLEAFISVQAPASVSHRVWPPSINLSRRSPFTALLFFTTQTPTALPLCRIAPISHSLTLSISLPQTRRSSALPQTAPYRPTCTVASNPAGRGEPRPGR
ncbi:hypothetical protein OIDMADRAFT_50617 [Oidiodendron maius Zn]|uniref:Uncharacterized protein n=1 Tax=Oidiodendron maius (strain Zn) TaxID=913774 RepID=A0A0C3HR84_OIDMZ|nr:hypothetical protein OIDMADRAFT_50617 [Oidiodendron maius Zn]